jgi:DNA-binding transcriptional LysR family regulator
VELSQVRAFVAVSRLGTITAAADELHVTPSPLSRTIRELERQLGSDLFTRTYHQFERTHFGDGFLPLAVELLAQADEAARFGSDVEAPLRIGGTPWTSRSLTRRFVEATQTVNGGGRPGYASDLSSVLLQSLRHGEVDLVLVHLPVEDAGISATPLAQYSYSVAAVGDDSLDLGRPLRLSDLAGRRILSLPLIMQPAPMRKLLDDIYAAGVESIEEVDLRDIVGLQARMARTGELMLITPSEDLPGARFFDLSETNVYPVADGEISFEVGLAWRTRDVVHHAAIASVVAALSPPHGQVPYLA